VGESGHIYGQLRECQDVLLDVNSRANTNFFRETYIEGLQAQLKKGGEQRRDDDGHEDAQHSDGPNVIQVVGFDLPEDNYETC
jgi:hypothetical protein